MLLLSDFDYDLPEDLIAQFPADKRENSRMLVLNRNEHSISHKHFYDIVDLIEPDSLLVLNNTKVLPARLYGTKETGAKIEIFLLKPVEDSTEHESVWQVLIKPSKRVKSGTIVKVSDELSVEVIKRLEDDGEWLVKLLYSGENLLDVLHRNGNIPLPPYIERKMQTEDIKKLDFERYQTVYAKDEGSVAAPTAGLHFTKEILEQEKIVDSTLKRMVPRWKRNINGFAEYHQKMLRYMLQEGFTAMAIFQDKNIFANMPKMGAAVFHEIGHLMEPVSNIQAIKMKSPLPYFIAGSLLMPKLDTGENGEKKLNKGLNILRNCTPILAAAAWIPLIKTEFEASSDGVKITKPFLDNQNLNILKKAYKYAGSTYVMGAVATGLALFAGLKCKDWLLENRKQIAKKIQDKI